jgi:tyrosine-specific transport protein
MTTPFVSKGNLLGGILLIAGCCIGAGMLGLPVQSASAGFLPSSISFFVCWLFMLCTGLLLLEVNLWFGREVSIVTLADQTLGRIGKGIAWSVFLFLFYSLMVAYIAASGSLIADNVQVLFNQHWYAGSSELLFCFVFGLILYAGTQAVDWFNRLLMLGLILSYICLVFVGAPHINLNLLQHREWRAVTLVIPTVLVSFGFHNLIPSLATYFYGQVKPLKQAIIIGSALPLIIYLAWNGLILGLIPLQEFKQALDQGEIATEALRSAVGASWITDIAQLFAFFALITSFLSVALSFVDFLADALKIKKSPQGKLLLIALVLCPPLVCALLYPTIFLSALNVAGGFGAVILFGILPAAMAWSGRYRHKIDAPHLVPGGKPLLILIIAFSLAVMLLQVF